MKFHCDQIYVHMPVNEKVCSLLYICSFYVKVCDLPDVIHRSVATITVKKKNKTKEKKTSFWQF